MKQPCTIPLPAGMNLSATDRWLVLSEPCVAEAAELPTDTLGQPGLWKSSGNGHGCRRVFEIPAWVVGELDEDLAEAAMAPGLQPWIRWALATHAGKVPSRWRAPARALVEKWLPESGLTLRTRACLRQGELELDTATWVLRMPITAVPAELPEPRRRALGRLAAEAQSRWAMVRVGRLPGAGAATLAAEVNLTGAPRSELLFSASVDVLRHAVAWLVETAEVLADPSVAIACLASSGNNKPSS